MADEPATPRLAASSVEVIDVRITRIGIDWPLIFAAVAVIVVVSVCVAVFLSALPALGSSMVLRIVIGTVLVGVIVSVLFLIHRGQKGQTRHRVGSALAKIEEQPLDELVNEIFASAPMDPRSLVVELLKGLVEKGRIGIVLRSCEREPAQPLHPITVPFEPVPLDESEPAFAGMEDLKQDDRDSARSESGSDVSATPGSLPRRRVMRNITLGGGWAATILFSVFFAFAVLESASAGRASSGLIIWGIALLSLLIGFGGRGAWQTNAQWLLVPGGLIRRTPSEDDQEWDLRLFDPQRSVLVVHKNSLRVWLIFAADADGVESASVTKKEAELLLWAWLSPLKPPPIERLTDLT